MTKFLKIFFSSEIIVILLSVFIFSMPSFQAKNFFMTHDGMHHLIRTIHYFQGLKEGQFPVFWAGYLNKTLGSPIFIYTPPLFYLLTSSLKLVNINTFLSFKLVIFFLNLIFTIGAYFWLRLYFNKAASLLASLMMLFTPYRISQIYVRGAFSEFAALSFIPLFLYYLNLGFRDFYISNKRLLTVLFLSLSLLSHTILIFIISPLICLNLILLYLKNKNIKLLLINITWLFFACILLTSFIYFPVLFELNKVKFFLATSYVFQYHFIKFWQLFNPHWGFGFSMPGTTDDGMSFQLGTFNWVIIITSIIFLFFRLIKNQKLLKKDHNIFGYLLTFFLAISLMIESKINLYIYEKIYLLKNIQFPWRFLSLCLLTVGYLGAYLFSLIKLSRKKLMGIYFLILLLTALYLKTNVPMNYSDEQLFKFASDSTFTHEFTPIWRDKNSDNDYILTDKVYALEEAIKPLNLMINSRGTSFSFNATKPLTIRINTLYFPGIELLNNNKLINFNILTPEDNTLKENRDISGIIEFKVDTGTHNIRLNYSRTKWGKGGFYFSIVGWALFALIFFYNQTCRKLKTLK